MGVAARVATPVCHGQRPGLRARGGSALSTLNLARAVLRILGMSLQTGLAAT